jgi:hypothetical protein
VRLRSSKFERCRRAHSAPPSRGRPSGRPVRPKQAGSLWFRPVLASLLVGRLLSARPSHPCGLSILKSQLRRIAGCAGSAW